MPRGKGPEHIDEGNKIVGDRSRRDQSSDRRIGHLPGKEGDGTDLFHEPAEQFAQIGQVRRRLSLDADQNVQQ